MKRLLLNITRYFLPILFVSYLVSFTCFPHVHVVGGLTIVHSHPFKKGVVHNHSTAELLQIHFLSHLMTDDVAVVFALSLFTPFFLSLLLGRSQYARYHSLCQGVVGLRAPPVIHFSIL
ncbi:hypothetical protein AB9N12_14515 [Bacteroides sp. AN502(2024)]|uniref:hypothetical protein n=1 Tax=Bacteroides sp. AN502(2024) TaxID=3160599 RepID=UPI003511BBD6